MEPTQGINPNQLIEGQSYTISENGNPIQARFVFKRIEDGFALFDRFNIEEGAEEGAEEGYDIENNMFLNGITVVPFVNQQNKRMRLNGGRRKTRKTKKSRKSKKYRKSKKSRKTKK